MSQQSLFVIHAIDRPNSVALRMETRPKHLEYLSQQRVILAGPMLSDDGQSPIGSMVVIAAESISAAKQIADNDPYNVVGLFESVRVAPWKCGIKGDLSTL
eukprot:TRINITY_DN372_c0_g1_i1.p2 TRINITY_DN372_c0_g1~~TRINITY_DN372_c0_g1_i1.p2  ORF type:complete len:101 (-),score=20.15 TRINITY_DN372_c0_g1_i1:22-324(-)